ncbi:MAG: zinc metalloprotease HtpX [Terriglobia bacterium]
MNTLKTGVLLVALTLILIYGGAAVAGQQGMTIALVLAVVLNFGAYFYGDKIALRMSRARPVSREQAPRMYEAMERLCGRTGLPLPRLYIIPEAQPNAFATGRSPSKASVAATAGLLEVMNDEELEGVLAHELAHVRNRDTLIMSVAATIAGAITYAAHLGYFAALFGGGGRGRNGGGNAFVMLLMLILAPLAAMMIQMAISRQREYAADAAAARFIGHGYGLASALEKLGSYSKRVPMRRVEPSQAHMFIIHPLSGGGMAKLFSTHPPVEERIRRLRALTV